MLAFLPIHGTHHVTTLVEGSRRTPFDHIVDMCTWCVNEGCVLRIRDTKRPLHFEPDAGVYERTAGTGKWKWQVQKEFAWELFARYDKPNKAGDAETRVEENPFLSWGLFYNF
ncbi:hypothetical protein BN946_scf185000.g10 [Trametes cinnabarina]|uniref:Uncharacterized protein n=1 Tax=Pycnoporus cinnabarinus TaxID=5643 RepID=A0A060S398_PYCCI|nr:hypothetical protein BN946_scf185000.g10 [Trametes cinnabarina]